MAIRMPTLSTKHLLDVTPEMLHKLRVTAVLLDIDNTLSHHDAPIPFDGVVDWTKKMTAAGFQLMIVGKQFPDQSMETVCVKFALQQYARSACLFQYAGVFLLVMIGDVGRRNDEVYSERDRRGHACDDPVRRSGT